MVVDRSSYPRQLCFVVEAVIPILEARWSYELSGGNKEIAESLLNEGAYVNELTVKDSTPLSMSIFEGYSNVVELLIDHGAEIDGSIDDPVVKSDIGAMRAPFKEYIGERLP
jgi:ankyrin repeat protein